MIENLLDPDQILLDPDRQATPEPPSLDISHLTIEDDTPVDNFQSEVQQRLLVEPLYSAVALPPPFLAAANVGLFYQIKADPIVPDIMVSLGVQRPDDFSKKRNRAYFTWEFGKVPDLCLEIVSNQEGDELALSAKSRAKGRSRHKFDLYAQIGVRYYAVFDPLRQIQNPQEMNNALLRVWAIDAQGYQEITPTQGLTQSGDWVWLNGLGLGLSLWEGMFEETVPRLWARWCDRNGKVIATGAEGQNQARAEAKTERLRADTERQRADRLAEQLRALGITPEEP
jgi:Uma2 family endonuclease